MEDILILIAVFFVWRIVLKAIWGGWSANDYRRDR